MTCGCLFEALAELIAAGRSRGSSEYSARVLDRIWKTERFSWSMTTLLHTFPEHDAFTRRMQRAEFDALVGSPTAQRVLAENYTGQIG